MKRSRAKAVGLGLAVLTGHLSAADEKLPPDRPPAAAAVAPAAAPPTAVRGGEWVMASSTDPGTVWLPSRKPALVRPPVTVGPPSAAPAAPPGGPVVVAGGIPVPVPLDPLPDEPAGPRLSPGASVGPLPPIPALPDIGPVGPPPAASPQPTPVEVKEWRPVSQPPASADPSAAPLPAPQPVSVPPVPSEMPIPTPGPGRVEPVPLDPAPGPRIGNRGGEPRPDLPPAGPAPIPGPMPSTPAATPPPLPTPAPAGPIPPTVGVDTLIPQPLPPKQPDAAPKEQPKDPPKEAPKDPAKPADAAKPLPAPRATDPPVPPADAVPRRDPATVVPPLPGSLVRPVVPGVPPDCELPVAPPELMLPPGAPVPGKKGVFGSPPIRISKDYPPLHDLVAHDGWGRGRAGRGSGSPATDRLSFRAEYLMAWVPAQEVPVLASTSTTGGFGFLGDPGTRALLGPGSFGGTLRHGLRVQAGWWFNECGRCGVDGSFFLLGRRNDSASFDAGTTPVITRPIFAPNFGREFGEVVAFPGFSTGSLTVDADSFLWGFDANLRHAFCKTCDYRAEWFAGYRFLALDEGLRVTEFITALPGNPNDPAGTRVVVQDRFDTRNTFHGGQLGLAAERNWGRVSLDGRASVALGNTHQQLDISGSQVRTRPGLPPAQFTGGLLAVGPNLGRFTRDEFSVVPQAAVNLGYWVTPKVKAYFGYNFLYWSNVIRPGEQIDRVVDLTFVPNPPPGVVPSGQLRPQPLFKQSDLWVNGIQFGLEWRW